MWCSACIVHRITILTVLTHLKWKISGTSTTAVQNAAGILHRDLVAISFSHSLFSSHSIPETVCLFVCSLSTIKYFYLWLFQFGWNSISGTSKSLSTAISFNLSVCVCVYIFHFNVYLFHSCAMLLLPFQMWCLTVELAAFLFTIQQIALWNQNVRTCIWWSLLSWCICCCVKRSRLDRNTSMSSIIVRLFISMWNRKNGYGIKSSKILSICRVRFNN